MKKKPGGHAAPQTANEDDTCKPPIKEEHTTNPMSPGTPQNKSPWGPPIL